jgi:hypothetical protein
VENLDRRKESEGGKMREKNEEKPENSQVLKTYFILSKN